MTTYELKVTSDQGSQIQLTSQMPEEVIRLLQLSGLSMPEPQVTMQAPMDPMAPLGVPDAQGACVQEQQAEHDYGHDAEDAVTMDIKDYNFNGRADLPERLTSARFGSNPMKSDMREHVTYDRIRVAYQEFLAEQENDAGHMSPLTSETRDEFDPDPFDDQKPVTDGTHSPMSTIVRQKMPT